MVDVRKYLLNSSYLKKLSSFEILSTYFRVGYYPLHKVRLKVLLNSLQMVIAFTFVDYLPQPSQSFLNFQKFLNIVQF